jgi:Tfp pilus assembly protein PilX
MKYKQQGFILPVVVILSVALSIVGVTALRTVSNSSVQLTGQYYSQLAREAAQAGISKALACLKSGTTTWANPLKPNTDCSGTSGAGLAYLSKNDNWKSSFEVPTPTAAGTVTNVTAIGTVSLVGPDGTTSIGQIVTKNSRASVTNTPATSTNADTDGTGERHTCAIADGKAYCWGYNYYGQHGTGSTNPTNASPVAVSTSGVLAGKTVTNLSTGERHTCAIADGKAYCWGYNYYGQHGTGSTNPTNASPVAVSTSGVLAGKTITSISVGERHSCAVADGTAYCWGYNYYGQLGDNTTTNRYSPVAVNASGVLAGKTVTSINAAEKHTCAIADGKMYCWGYNYYGQLGTGSTYPSSLVPVAVSIAGVLAGKTVSDGSTHTDAVYKALIY